MGQYQCVCCLIAQCEAKLAATVHDAAPDDSRAALALMKSRWPERLSERREDNVGFSAQFQINLHLNDPLLQKQWDEQVRRRRLAMQIPAVSADDAQAIELAAPLTKV